LADILLTEPAEKFRGYAGGLDKCCKAMAVASGSILTLMACMSIWSIVGRSFFEKPLVGDYELVQAFSAVAVALALPYTHWVKANVIVDFFTMHASPLVNGVLDAAANLLVALFSAVIAWRLAYGLVSLRASEDASMLLSIPTWWIYLVMVPSFALLSLTALYGLSVNIERLRK